MSPGVEDRFTLHVAGPADLTRLGAVMNNCLATYGRGRTGGTDRIVEVREDGRTRYAVHIRGGRIVMFEAPNNRPPAPADVPEVRALLERHGLLAATRPRPARRRPARAAPRRHRPRPVAPPGLSVQGLAADLLGPAALDRTEWPELGAALWAMGVLATLPDPTETAYAQVMVDLAERVATGAGADLAGHPPPSQAERDAARRRLVAGGPPRRQEDWQRHRMAEILAVPLHW